MDDCRNGNATSQGRLVSVGTAAEELGISSESVRKLCKAGELSFVLTFGGHRRISTASIRRWQGFDEEPNDRQTVCYSRVSTQAQKNAGNLQRQNERLIDFCEAEFQNTREDILVISESGSGLNENRKGFLRLIDLVLSGKIGRIVIQFDDRLMRSGIRLFRAICERMGVDLIVTNAKAEMSDEEEMTADILSLMTVYSARVHGKRGGQTKQMVITESAKQRILELHQQGVTQAEIPSKLNGFTCPKTRKIYGIHAVRQTLDEQEKLQRAIQKLANPIEKFVSERCIRSEKERCFTSPFHRAYVSWAKSQGIPEISSNALTRNVKRLLGLQTEKSSSGYSYFIGISLKDNERASRSHLG